MTKPLPKPKPKPTKLLKDIVDKLCEKNPNLQHNPAYLMLEVWDVQGLRLYPGQRELFLSGNLSTSEGISRQLRRQIKEKGLYK